MFNSWRTYISSSHYIAFYLFVRSFRLFLVRIYLGVLFGVCLSLKNVQIGDAAAGKCIHASLPSLHRVPCPEEFRRLPVPRLYWWRHVEVHRPPPPIGSSRCRRLALYGTGEVTSKVQILACASVASLSIGGADGTERSDWELDTQSTP